jgi:hypothetical protein
MPTHYNHRILKPNTKHDYSPDDLLTLSKAKNEFSFFAKQLNIKVAPITDLNNKVILIKHKQQDIRTLLSAYLLWNAMFHNKLFNVILTKNNNKELFNICKQLYESCPNKLKIGVQRYQKDNIAFENYSNILQRTISPDIIRGCAVNNLILDQVEDSKDFHILLTAIYPALSTGSKLFLIYNKSKLLPDYYRKPLIINKLENL